MGINGSGVNGGGRKTVAGRLGTTTTTPRSQTPAPLPNEGTPPADRFERQHRPSPMGKERSGAEREREAARGISAGAVIHTPTPAVRATDLIGDIANMKAQFAIDAIPQDVADGWITIEPGTKFRFNTEIKDGEFVPGESVSFEDQDGNRTELDGPLWIDVDGAELVENSEGKIEIRAKISCFLFPSKNMTEDLFGVDALPKKVAEAMPIIRKAINQSNKNADLLQPLASRSIPLGSANAPTTHSSPKKSLGNEGTESSGLSPTDVVDLSTLTCDASGSLKPNTRWDLGGDNVIKWGENVSVSYRDDGQKTFFEINGDIRSLHAGALGTSLSVGPARVKARFEIDETTGRTALFIDELDVREDIEFVTPSTDGHQPHRLLASGISLRGGSKKPVLAFTQEGGAEHVAIHVPECSFDKIGGSITVNGADGAESAITLGRDGMSAASWTKIQNEVGLRAARAYISQAGVDEKNLPALMAQLRTVFQPGVTREAVRNVLTSYVPGEHIDGAMQRLWATREPMSASMSLNIDTATGFADVDLAMRNAGVRLGETEILDSKDLDVQMSQGLVAGSFRIKARNDADGFRWSIDAQEGEEIVIRGDVKSASIGDESNPTQLQATLSSENALWLTHVGSSPEGESVRAAGSFGFELTEEATIPIPGFLDIPAGATGRFEMDDLSLEPGGEPEMKGRLEIRFKAGVGFDASGLAGYSDFQDADIQVWTENGDVVVRMDASLKDGRFTAPFNIKLDFQGRSEVHRGNAAAPPEPTLEYFPASQLGTLQPASMGTDDALATYAKTVSVSDPETPVPAGESDLDLGEHYAAQARALLNQDVEGTFSLVEAGDRVHAGDVSVLIPIDPIDDFRYEAIEKQPAYFPVSPAQTVLNKVVEAVSDESIGDGPMVALGSAYLHLFATLGSTSNPPTMSIETSVVDNKIQELRLTLDPPLEISAEAAYGAGTGRMQLCHVRGARIVFPADGEGRRRSNPLLDVMGLPSTAQIQMDIDMVDTGAFLNFVTGELTDIAQNFMTLGGILGDKQHLDGKELIKLYASLAVGAMFPKGRIPRDLSEILQGVAEDEEVTVGGETKPSASAPSVPTMWDPLRDSFHFEDASVSASGIVVAGRLNLTGNQFIDFGEPDDASRFTIQGDRNDFTVVGAGHIEGLRINTPKGVIALSDLDVGTPPDGQGINVRVKRDPKPPHAVSAWVELSDITADEVAAYGIFGSLAGAGGGENLFTGNIQKLKSDNTPSQLVFHTGPATDQAFTLSLPGLNGRLSLAGDQDGQQLSLDVSGNILVEDGVTTGDVAIALRGNGAFDETLAIPDELQRGALQGLRLEGDFSFSNKDGSFTLSPKGESSSVAVSGALTLPDGTRVDTRRARVGAIEVRDDGTIVINDIAGALSFKRPGGKTSVSISECKGGQIEFRPDGEILLTDLRASASATIDGSRFDLQNGRLGSGRLGTNGQITLHNVEGICSTHTALEIPDAADDGLAMIQFRNVGITAESIQLGESATPTLKGVRIQTATPQAAASQQAHGILTRLEASGLPLDIAFTGSSNPATLAALDTICDELELSPPPASQFFYSIPAGAGPSAPAPHLTLSAALQRAFPNILSSSPRQRADFLQKALTDGPQVGMSIAGGLAREISKTAFIDVRQVDVFGEGILDLHAGEIQLRRGEQSALDTRFFVDAMRMKFAAPAAQIDMGEGIITAELEELRVSLDDDAPGMSIRAKDVRQEGHLEEAVTTLVKRQGNQEAGLEVTVEGNGNNDSASLIGLFDSLAFEQGRYSSRPSSEPRVSFSTGTDGGVFFAGQVMNTGQFVGTGAEGDYWKVVLDEYKTNAVNVQVCITGNCHDNDNVAIKAAARVDGTLSGVLDGQLRGAPLIDEATQQLGENIRRRAREKGLGQFVNPPEEAPPKSGGVDRGHPPRGANQSPGSHGPTSRQRRSVVPGASVGLRRNSAAKVPPKRL